MKMRKIYSAVFAAALALSLALPAFASSETTPVMPEEQLPTQKEEGTPAEIPEEPVQEPPAGIPADTEQPMETPETPIKPETPVAPENPDAPNTPAVPDLPESPTAPETPAAPEPPAQPETPAVPEIPAAPATPPLPADQLPVQTVPDIQPPVQTPVPREEAPVIEVLVPETGSVIVNPYGLPVMQDGRETTEQIAGSTMFLENRSSVAVDVSAVAVGTALGDVVFAYQPPLPDAAVKEVFLYAEFQAVPYPEADVPWTGVFSDLSSQMMVTTYGIAKDNLMRLDAAGMPYSLGAVRLFGSVAADPAQPWQSGDGFHVRIAFTFTPAEPPEGSVPDESGTAGLGLPDTAPIEEASAASAPSAGMPDPAVPSGWISEETEKLNSVSIPVIP